MDPDAAVRQAIWDLDNNENTDALVGLNDYAQWLSRGGWPAEHGDLAELDTAVQAWADRGELS